MTVNATYAPVQYQGNGTTTAFAFPYAFFAPADVVVTLYDSVAQTNVSSVTLGGGGTYGYTVIGTQDVNTGEYLSGGTVTFNTAPLGTYEVVLGRAVSPTQPVSLTNNAPFPAKTLEGALDRLTMVAQQLISAGNYTLRLPIADSVLSSTLPPAAQRANMALMFDSSGSPVVGALAAGNIVSTAMVPVVQASTTGAAAVAMGVALLNAPTLVNPIVGTQSPSDNSTKAASTAYVQAALTAFLAAYPQTTVSTKSVAYTITTSDNNSLIVAGAYPMTLPSAPAGAFRVTILSSATGTTILPNGNTVNLASGGTSSTISLPAAGDFVTLVWDGTVWRVLGGSAAMIAIALAKSTVSGGAFNTTYTNSTGHTIFVSATVSLTANATVTLNIAGVSWAWAGQGAGASVGFTCQVSGPVGPGETYSFASVGSATLQYITVAK